MDLVTGAMGSLLPKLGELLKEEYNLKKRVKKDIKSLSEEMTSMEAALRKVGQLPRDQLDEQVRLWADAVRELSYDMEDVVDGFLVRVEGSDQLAQDSDGFKRMMKKMANLFKKGKARHQIADAIEEIKDQVKEVANRRDRYWVDGVVANASSTTTVDPRLFSLYQQQKELVGIDDAKKELKNMLTDGCDDVSRQQLKVLSIFGFGGLGKTSLAKAVYDELKAEFDVKAFVPVGRNPDVTKVLKNIIFELDQEKHTSLNGGATLDERQLINVIQGMLGNKRYIIVIDDIWDIQAWKIIKCALLDDNCGSRVITTTRILDVAKKAGDVYKLATLSADKSEKLFYSRLGDESKSPEVEVSKTILRKCGGVPLAIITMASLLAGKPREDWSSVYKSIGFGHGYNEEVDNTRKILLFSYYDLPSHLRTCMLHLSIYPEDYEIRNDDVIWKWIAEGLVLEEPDIWSYDIGERYLNELINRSMIQPIEYEGVFYAFRVHDMVLDMICSLSAEENFVNMSDNNKQHQSLQRTVRRLALQKSVLQEDVDPSIETNLSHVRSLYVTSCHIGVMPSFFSYPALRVLSMEGCTFVEGCSFHFGHLERLIRLRYLRLGAMPINELPEEIGALSFLQVLDLSDTDVDELSQSIGLLRHLKCLHADESSVHTPGWIGSLISLEDLWLRSTTAKIAEEVSKLTQLRRLGIRFIEECDESSNKSLVASLGNLQKIRVLYLSYDEELSSGVSWEGYVPSRHLRRLYLKRVKFCRLPMWIDSSRLPNLSYLEIKVEAQDVEILGRFPELVSLKWKAERYVTVDVMAGAFPKLRYFETSVGCRFLSGAMPVVEELELAALMSVKNTSIDSFTSLRNLSSLRKVTVYLDCSGARATDVEQAEAAATQALAMCPNRPIVDFDRENESAMIHSNQKED